MGSRNRQRMHSRMIQDYRQRIRDWTVAAMPSMPAHEWKMFEEWMDDYRFERQTFIKKRQRHNAPGVPPTIAIITAAVTEGDSDG